MRAPCNEAIGSLGDACAFSSRCRRAFHLANACRRKLIQSNLRLAVHIARRYNQHGIPMSDLIQDANVGLIKAVERFDPTKGFRFSTYAYGWISEEVKRSLQRGMRLVHTPENVVEEGVTTLGDRLEAHEQASPEYSMSERDRRRTLKAMFSQLTDREQVILSRRYGLNIQEPDTLQVISDDMEISRERVRQIEKLALHKLQALVGGPETPFRL